VRMIRIRTKVRCINWSLPRAPKAISYVLVDGEVRSADSHETWADAMGRANWLADIYTRAYGKPAFEQRAS
jgi:hypothetical protein